MHYLNITILLLAATFASAATKPATYNPATSALVQPDAATFAAKNNLVTNEVICVRVDMTRDGDYRAHTQTITWSDCELKVLDKNGNIVYFASSVWRDRSYHADAGVIDNNVKIYYYVSGSNSSNGVCAKPKKLLVQSGADDYSSGNSISTYEGLWWVTLGNNAYVSRPACITAVEFYPNLSGTLNGLSIREIFLNPENSIIVSRKNPNQLERAFTNGDGGVTDINNGQRIWRPAIAQYYRTLP